MTVFIVCLSSFACLGLMLCLHALHVHSLDKSGLQLQPLIKFTVVFCGFVSLLKSPSQHQSST